MAVTLFDSVLTKYKLIRNDITSAQIIKTGEPGGIPEVYEKINQKTGKGCVVLFANARGSYFYITQSTAAATVWHNEGVEVKRDRNGAAIITAHFEEPSAKIILFGAF